MDYTRKWGNFTLVESIVQSMRGIGVVNVERVKLQKCEYVTIMVSVKLLLLCLLVIFFCSHHTSLHSICVAFANLIMQCRMNSCIKLQYPDFISAEHVHFLFQQAAALLHTS